MAQWGPHAQDGEMPPPTAVQVARQLWQFHGCTQEQHQVKEEERAQAQGQANSPQHSCCSLPQITTLLTGANANGSPSTAVPDVLSQHKLAKRGEYETGSLNWQAMFEGDPSVSTSATASATASTTATATPLPARTPWGLCLDTHYSHS